MFNQTKITIAGVGTVNVVSWSPDTPVSSKLLTVLQFPGSGEAGTDPSLAYRFGPLYFVKNRGFAPNDMQFIFVQTPYTYGTYDNPIAGAFVRGAVQYVAGLPNVDPGKLFLTGLSYGADHCIFYMQKEDSAHYIPIAGIIPMSMNMYGSVGNSPNDKLGGNDIRFNKTPIWAFCGNADSFLSGMQHFYALATDPNGSADPANPVKANIKFSIYQGAHGGWNGQYDNTGALKIDGTKDQSIYDWMRTLVASSGSIVTAPPPVVVPPAKTLVAVSTTYTYSDGSIETIKRP